MKFIVNTTGRNHDILLGDILKNTHGVLVEDINITGFSHPIELDIARKFELLFKPFYKDYEGYGETFLSQPGVLVDEEISIGQHIDSTTTTVDWNEMFIFNGVLQHAIAENLIELIPSKPDNKRNPTMDIPKYMIPAEWHQDIRRRIEEELNPLYSEESSTPPPRPELRRQSARQLFYNMDAPPQPLLRRQIGYSPAVYELHEGNDERQQIRSILNEAEIGDIVRYVPNNPEGYREFRIVFSENPGAPRNTKILQEIDQDSD